MRVVKENVYRLLFKCAEMSFELERHPELKKKVIIADIYIYRICAWFVEFCLAFFNEMRIKRNGGRGRRRQKKTEVISLRAYSFVVR